MAVAVGRRFGSNISVMSALPKRFFTPEEYVEFENRSDYKSQYIAGEIFAMAGTQIEHGEILKNLVVLFNERFRGRPCRFYFQDIRLRVVEGDMYTYPDLMALCGEPRFEGKAQEPPSLLNPQVVFEILSRSTEDFDRRDKFARYRRLETRGSVTPAKSRAAGEPTGKSIPPAC